MYYRSSSSMHVVMRACMIHTYICRFPYIGVLMIFFLFHPGSSTTNLNYSESNCNGVLLLYILLHILLPVCSSSTQYAGGKEEGAAIRRHIWYIFCMFAYIFIVVILNTHSSAHVHTSQILRSIYTHIIYVCTSLLLHMYIGECMYVYIRYCCCSM